MSTLLFRIFEKDEHVLNRSSQSSQLLPPRESQKFVRLIKMHSSEPRVTGTEFIIQKPHFFLDIEEITLILVITWCKQ